MNEITSWVLIIIGISIPPIIAVLLNHLFQKRKLAAETEKINLENKITKEITYGQLKSENKQKDIKNKIEILKQIVILEEEIKNKKEITESDQKKLDSLEMIKKEFKQSFTEKVEEKAKLTEKGENNEEKTKKSRVKSKNIQ